LSAAATFVLIPGAGADPRVYGATIEALEAHGHRALAPPLPLTDHEAAPSDHAAAVLAALPDDADPLVVVAQSLGAFAGPLVAAEADAAGLVLLAPMIPAPGESAGEWWSNTGHEAAIAGLRERFGPMSEWDREALAHVFLHDVDEATQRASAGLGGAPGPGMFAEPWPLERWPQIPTVVLAAREDRLFPLPFQRRLARERLGLEAEEIDGGHLPMLSRPEELARRLDEITRSSFLPRSR
jgi:pimeloyl-ACP methyl ester carboxylesterase